MRRTFALKWVRMGNVPKKSSSTQFLLNTSQSQLLNQHFHYHLEKMLKCSDYLFTRMRVNGFACGLTLPPRFRNLAHSNKNKIVGSKSGHGNLQLAEKGKHGNHIKGYNSFLSM